MYHNQSVVDVLTRQFSLSCINHDQIPAPQEAEPAAKAPATRGGKRKAETPEPAPTGDSDEGAKLVPKDLRVVDLRRELRARGLATSGVKAVLVARLEEALAEEEFEGEKENALPQIEEANEVRSHQSTLTVSLKHTASTCRLVYVRMTGPGGE